MVFLDHTWMGMGDLRRDANKVYYSTEEGPYQPTPAVQITATVTTNAKLVDRNQTVPEIISTAGSAARLLQKSKQDAGWQLFNNILLKYFCSN